jgi:hypothetical protein
VFLSRPVDLEHLGVLEYLECLNLEYLECLNLEYLEDLADPVNLEY